LTPEVLVDVEPARKLEEGLFDGDYGPQFAERAVDLFESAREDENKLFGDAEEDDRLREMFSKVRLNRRVMFVRAPRWREPRWATLGVATSE